MARKLSRKAGMVWSIAAIAIVVVAGLGMWWRISSAAASAKDQCFANQRLIEQSAQAYVDEGHGHTMAQLDGAVDGSSPLVTSQLDGNPQFLAFVPRCSKRPGEDYIVKDGRTDCPVHGTYQ